MESRSHRLPFCLSSPRSSYLSSPTVPSSTLGSSRLYGRESLLSTDRFPRASSTYKTDLDQQNARLLSSSRDYGNPDCRPGSWKLPTSLTSSSRSYDRPWNDASLGTRSKLTESEGRLGMRSGLLTTSDDGDSKRAKLSYSNRGLYSRTPVSSLTGSSYSSGGLHSGRGSDEKRNDNLDSSWSSCRLLSLSSSSSSSKPLLSSRREQETKYEPPLSSFGERRMRPTGASSSLYQTDRVTSTYAQGARPKESTYSSSCSSSFSASRQSSLGHHLPSSASYRSPPPARDLSSRTTSRFSSGSSARCSSQEQTANSYSDTPPSCFYSSRSSWHTSPAVRPEAALPPRPTPESAEPESRSSTRRLLSRLFSRRSSQESSSGSSSVRSLDDDSPSTGGESVDGDEGARISGADPDAAAPETTGRNRRADLAPIQESNGYRSSPAGSRMPSWREPSVGSSNNTSSGGGGGGGGGSSSSWLSSSLRGRCPPLLSRLRRHARDESARSAADAEEGYSNPPHLLRRWDDVEHKTTAEDDDCDDDDDDDDDDEEESEEEEGAVGLDAYRAGHPCRLEDETLPDLEEGSVAFPTRRRVALYENISASLSQLRGIENQLEEPKEKASSGRDQEKLQKIKERLLMEESDEEEGDLCRICQMGEESASNPLIQPCRCTGSLQYVHQECIKRWLRSKIGSGTNLDAITTCELCKEKLRLNIDNFDIQELYRTHMQSEYDEFISSGLYLVVLLHFCEQRFSDVLGAVDAAGLFNLVRILHDHMDNLESSHGESDGEVHDHRPSIEFSDLDDDLEDDY